MKLKYDIVEKDPVAKFYYKGSSHSHPVRRTILIIEDRPSLLIGYELRDGRETRTLDVAPVKSFRKDRIAKYGDYDRLRRSLATYNKKATESTLKRLKLLELLTNGV